MTREHKLSLIVGFSIVLLVAVLISDHFSSAQQHALGLAETGEPASASTTPPRQLQAPTSTGPAQGQGLTRQLASGSQPTTPAMGRPLTQPGTRPGTRPGTLAGTQAIARGMSEPMSEPQKLVINQGSRPTPGVSAATPGGENSLIAQGRDALESLRERIQQNGMEYLKDAPVAAEVGRQSITPTKTATPTSGTRTPNVRLPEGTSAGPSSSSARATPRQATPKPTRLHVVQEGESLYRIAERFYGDGNLWRQLAAHNTDRVANNGSVRVGVALKIPEPAALGISTPPSSRAGTNTQATRRTASPTAPKPAATRTYIVRKGDTLGAICSRELGSSKRTDDVLALNPKLESADMIYVGMKLTLPSK